MSGRRKILWLLAFIVTGVLLYPSLPSLDPIISKTSSLEVQIRDTEIKIDQARAAQAEGQEFLARLETLRGRIPSDPDLEGLVNELSRRIAATGMRWTDGAPSALEQQAEGAVFRTWQISLTVAGPESGVFPLLESIAAADRTVTIDSVSVRTEGDKVVVAINARFYALLPGEYNDPQYQGS